MNKNRLSLFLTVIFFGLVLSAWNVAANRNFMEIILPKTEEPTPTISCQAPGFNFTKVINSDNAQYLLTTDFNRDGKLDIALASDSNQVTFFFGDGNGDLVNSKTILLTGSDNNRVLSIEEADFNQDGSPDYLVAKESGLNLLLNDGLGNMLVSDISKQNAGIIATADFNQDGKADFVSASGKNLSVFLGKGEGNFFEPTSFLSPVNVEWLLAKDFNLDSNNDIVVVGENKVVTFLGNKGKLFSPILATTSVNPKYVQSADFNQDGKLDLVVIDDNSPIFAQILINSGNGNFTANEAINTTLSPSAKKINRNLVVGDFNQDGKADFVISNAAPSFDPILEPTFARVFLGDGKGNVSYGPILGVGNARDLVATADFNNDGKLDLVRATSGQNNLEVNLSGISAGCITPNFISSQNSLGVNSPGRSVVADFNNDGKLDVISLNSETKNLSRLFGNDTGNLTAQVQIPLGLEPMDLAALDFDQDGNQDLVVANRFSNTVNLLMGDGAGNFNPASSISLENLEPVAIKTGDFNKDGIVDIIIANTTNIVLLTNIDRKGLAQSLILNAKNSLNSIEVADLNLDGNLDFVVGESEGSGLMVFLGNGKGNFTSKNILASCGISPRVNAIGDFNRDGFKDLLVSCNAGSNRVLLGDATSQFTKSISVIDGVISTFGDFNSDSNLDILVYTGESKFSLILGDGVGRTKSTISFSTDFTLSNALLNTGDFNQDGKLDFLVTDKNNNLVSLVLNTCVGSSSKLIEKGNFQIAPVGRAFPVPLEVKVIDVSGNGVSGVVVDFETPKVNLGPSGSFFGGVNKVSVKTNGEGVAVAPGFTANNFAGEYIVTANVVNDSGITLCGTVFNLTNREGNIILMPPSGDLPDATVGTFYNFTFTVLGGTPPNTFTSIGNLPLGLSLSPSGMITGIPETTAAATFDVQVLDSAMGTSTQTYNLAVVPSAACPAIGINPLFLTDGTVGAPYAQTLTATGGTAPYTFNLENAPAPGLALTPAGDVIGFPSIVGQYSFLVIVTDSLGCTGSASISLMINSCAPLTISPSTLPGTVVGTPYDQTLTASGGAPPYSFQVIMGGLPPGLSLSSNGMITGTTTMPGSFSFTVEASSDVPPSPRSNKIAPLAAGNGCVGTQNYTIDVGCTGITINPPSLPNAVVGNFYTQTFTASGGSPPYSISPSSSPPGLNLDTTGVLSGTPTTQGVFSFSVRAVDSLGCSTIQIYSIAVCGTITISPPSLPDATVGTPYDQTLTASGGVSPYIFSIVSRVLPPGLTLSSSGTITGTPTATGTFDFAIQADDFVSCNPGIQFYSITVTSAACPTITITPPVLSPGILGAPYSQMLGATGGTAPYAFSVASGGTGSTLPPGLSLAPSGAITGTPTATGTFLFSVQVTDGVGCTSGRAYAITVTCSTITINPPSLPNGALGVAYNQTLGAVGGTAPYAFSVASGGTGSMLPPGLSLDASGAITGAPTTPGTFPFSVQAMDSGGCTGSRAYTITVGCPTIAINPPSFPNGALGVAYNQTLGAVGGTAPYAFSVASGGTGSMLPPGLNLDPSGAITGTPTATGTFPFSVQVTDSGGCTATRAYAIAIACPTITINPPSLPNGALGIAYNQTLGAVGGTAPYAFSVASGGTGSTLPPGLNLDPSGAITGTPTTPGTFPFSVQAMDSGGCTGSRAYVITVACPTITINPTGLPSATLGVAYNQTLGAVGGTAPYAFSVVSGSIAPGLTLSPDGVISGVPTTLGKFDSLVEVRDKSDCVGSVSYSLVVANCPSITVTPPTLVSGTVGTSYSQTLGATGGTPPYSIEVGKTLPPGLNYDFKTNTIFGTPSTPGIFSFDVQVFDSQGCSNVRTYVISVARKCPEFGFAPATLSAATVGSLYNQTINVTPTALYNFSIASGTLPPGLTLQGNGSQTATIVGMPLLPGTFTFALQASDVIVNDPEIEQVICSGSQTYTITVSQGCGTINISPNTLPDSPVNATINQALTASGGTAPYIFSIAGGTLPNGVTLNSTGVLSGTPTSGGTFNFVVQARDANSCTGSKNYSLNITSTPGTVGFSSSSFSVTEGGRLTFTVTRTGGSSGQVSVNLASASGSAVLGREFAFDSRTVTFADADSTPKTFTIQTNANALVEPNKSFTLQLSNATGGARLGVATASVTITEKDPTQAGSLAFSQPNYIVNEGSGAATITVVRLNGGNIPISITYSTSPGLNAIPGTHYLETRGTLNFVPGTNSQSFNIPVLNDNQAGSNKIVNINLSNPTGGATLSGGFATLVIQEISTNPAQLKVNLQDVDFGAVNIGATNRQTVQVTNIGGQELNFTPTITGGGIRILGTPTTRLLANQSTTFDMVFEPAPGSLGVLSGALNITSNGGNAAIRLNARSIDIIPPKMSFNNLKGGELIPSGTQFKVPFSVIENDALSNSVVSFAAVLADGKVISGDIARLDGQSREATWNVPIDLEASRVKIFLKSSDRANNVTDLASGSFSIRRSISSAPILESLISFTPPPAGTTGAPSGLTVDAKESANGNANIVSQAVLSVQINFQAPLLNQVAPPRNVTVKAQELTDKGISQVAKVIRGIMPKAEGDAVIAGYNVYRLPQNDDGTMPSLDEIVKDENLVTTLPPDATGFNDKVSTSGGNNYTYSVSTFFGNGQMSSGSQPMGTNLPVIINPVFGQGTVFLDSGGSFIKLGATLTINDTETYTLQFDTSGTRFTVSKKQASNGNSIVIKRLIGKTSVVKMTVKNPDGSSSVSVMFSRKGVVKTIAQNRKPQLNIEPKADSPAIAGYNIYRAEQPADGRNLKPEEIIKPENLVGSIPGNMTTFMDKASTGSSSSGNFTYSVSTFFGNGQMSSGSQPASTDLPVVKNPKFEDRNFFVDSAASFIKLGATLIVNDTESYILEFDETGTRFTPRRKTGAPSNMTIDQFIKRGNKVRLTIKNPDGKLSVGVMFTR